MLGSNMSALQGFARSDATSTALSFCDRFSRPSAVSLRQTAPSIFRQHPSAATYAPTRNGENAQRFLGKYSGYLICDGFDGYNKLSEVTRCGCWAHARRKFVEALPTEEALLAISAAAKGVEFCVPAKYPHIIRKNASPIGLTSPLPFTKAAPPCPLYSGTA